MDYICASITKSESLYGTIYAWNAIIPLAVNTLFTLYEPTTKKVLMLLLIFFKIFIFFQFDLEDRRLSGGVTPTQEHPLRMLSPLPTPAAPYHPRVLSPLHITPFADTQAANQQAFDKLNREVIMQYYILKQNLVYC